MKEKAHRAKKRMEKMFFVMLATEAAIYEPRLMNTIVWNSFFHSYAEDDFPPPP